ncbi:MAG: 4'-phosphopantetheinyl transferase superfamily protein [Bacteroidota bacterium]
MSAITITNKFITDIDWLEPSACPFKVGDGIDVWSISFNPLLPVPDTCLAVISADDVARANKFYQQKDRNRFMISRWILRTILAKYIHLQPVEIEFESGKNKKPHVKNAGRQNLHYNMSHSSGNILLAVSDKVLGADIEFINTDFGYSDVLADNFSPPEVSYINEAEHINRFFTLWTRKEAITKATAQGLDCDLRQLPALDGLHIVEAGIIASDDDWLINSFLIGEKYAASIASSVSPGALQFFQLDATSGELPF